MNLYRQFITSLFLTEEEDMETILNKSFINPKTGKKIKVKSALGYKERDPQVYDIARKHVSVRFGDDAASKAEKGVSTDEPDVKTDTDREKRVIAGKDKTLSDVDTLQSDTFTSEIQPSDQEFQSKNEKFANPTPPPPYELPDSITNNPKFPKKYLSAFERIMNTQPKGEAAKWGHYSDLPGGAGRISAQAGELMTMMMTTMSDEEVSNFEQSLNTYIDNLVSENPKLKKPSTRSVDKSWVKSAVNNRKAILNRIRNEYPNAEIIAAAWDTEDDVSALGLSDYKTNKGFSTDVYFKIKTEDGREILDEVSLKKSTKVNFLNSGAGEFSKWDENLPDDINQNVYRDNQRQRNINFVEDNLKEVQSFLKTEDGKKIQKVLDSKNLSLEEALQGNSRSKQKVLFTIAQVMASKGNEDAKKVIQQDKKAHEEFVEKSVKAITENSNMREGMLNSIREEFPLKSISDGEETMAIGEYSLDRKTMENIFGTSDYDKIKESLVAVSGNPPFLGYRAKVGDEVIPIAKIGIREDGRGYGGQIKFEMQMDDRFAKKLSEANQQVY